MGIGKRRRKNDYLISKLEGKENRKATVVAVMIYVNNKYVLNDNVTIDYESFEYSSNEKIDIEFGRL